MLSQLFIKNVAVIESASIDFENGFNVFTGETGAGKSILIDSINAVLGGRTSRDLVRTGEGKAVVSAVFTDISKEAEKLLEELGYDIEDELMISREISTEGKSVCKVNMRPATAGVLKQLSSVLIDVHGQHDSAVLQNPELHIGYIDSFGNTESELLEYRESYKKLKSVEREIKKIINDDSDKTARIDMLKFQIGEIEAAAIEEGEEEELLALSKRIKSAENIMELISETISALDGNGENEGALEGLSSAIENCARLAEFFPQYEGLSEKFKEMYYEFEEFANDVKDNADELDFDPALQNRTERRLDQIFRLKRKYGGSVEEMFKYYNKAVLELENIEFSEERLEKLKKEREQLFSETAKLAGMLTKKRSEAAEAFEKAVSEELSYLNMPNVRFKVNFEETDFTESGKDNLEFYIATNAGEPLKPLTKIASGGELSRIMLSIKNVLADKDNVDTLIFDEVDTGISGSAAQKVGQKLKQVSKGRQIICVTHLAQVAAFADNHLLISKSTEGGKTFTSVESLEKEGRVNELARIMGGNLTDALKKSAEELLELSK
ncbi:MAG: DNA repair protein RecN [Oscillospiraceae bacterium]|nr:DNA repair protein RecN [Oscillospiraceae bacterium]MBP1575212.1 DNA repair protein RecN [Oscillospiraceae bacterium]